MKIKSLKLKEFMLFEDLEIDWSSNINIICGENSGEDFSFKSK